MNLLDKSNFRQMLLDSPDQFKKGFEIADGIKLEGKFKSIELSGMGGSALPGNILRVYLSELFKNNSDYKRFDVYQNRFYSLPHEAYDNCINFLMSYSGNTEETIESFEEVLRNKLPAIGVSSGGKVEQMCKENNIPHIKMPMPYPDFQPRLGTGYFFGALVKVLINQGMIPDTQEQILSIAKELKKNLGRIEEQGREIARIIKGKTPVIYTTTKFKPIAMIWKIMLNENGKTPAFWNFFPEVNHNEMNGFVSRQGEFIAIMLRDQQGHPRNIKRFAVMAEVLKDTGMDSEIVDYEEGDVFYKMFSSILLGGFTSYYLALEYGNDPTPVELVEKFKKLLEK